eukprot:Rmarinus@m.27321
MVIASWVRLLLPAFIACVAAACLVAIFWGASDIDREGAALNTSGQEIVGGIVSSGYPWIAAMLKNNHMYCGGSLIRPNVILTAAHCWLNRAQTHIDTSQKSYMKIRVGALEWADSSYEAYSITDVIVHEDYDPDLSTPENHDVAVVLIDGCVFSDTMPIVDESTHDLPTLEAVGQVVRVAGFGVTVAWPSSSSTPSNVLREVDVPIGDRDHCDDVMNWVVTDYMICASDSSAGKDSCSGDSGSPLFLTPDMWDGESYLQLGIASWGEGCAETGKYGVYTRVSRYTDWIAEAAAEIDDGRCGMCEGGCADEAECVVWEDTQSCVCNQGYEGSGEECSDIDECQSDDGACPAEASCENSPASYQCTCPAGYELSDSWDTCDNIDECAIGIHNCNTDVLCVDTAGSFICECVDGMDCYDVDECNEGTHVCNEHMNCHNAPGNYTCTCKTGYEDVALGCLDVDECERGTAVCPENSICQNVNGGYYCGCVEGFEDVLGGDTDSCEDIDECALGTDDCPSTLLCVNYPGTFFCECEENFETPQTEGESANDLDEYGVDFEQHSTAASCAVTVWVDLTFVLDPEAVGAMFMTDLRRSFASYFNVSEGQVAIIDLVSLSDTSSLAAASLPTHQVLLSPSAPGLGDLRALGLLDRRSFNAQSLPDNFWLSRTRSREATAADGGGNRPDAEGGSGGTSWYGGSSRRNTDVEDNLPLACLEDSCLAVRTELAFDSHQLAEAAKELFMESSIAELSIALGVEVVDASLSSEGKSDTEKWQHSTTIIIAVSCSFVLAVAAAVYVVRARRSGQDVTYPTPIATDPAVEDSHNKKDASEELNKPRWSNWVEPGSIVSPPGEAAVKKFEIDPEA